VSFRGPVTADAVPAVSLAVGQTHEMEKTQINPWTWQDALGFSQAWSVRDARHVIFLAGQAPISPDGQLVAAGDFEAQAVQVFENLRVVLEEAGASFDAVVKITVYLTDMSTFRDFGRIKATFMPGPQPASTAIGVQSLALPGMMVEVEAIAAV
jgi:2-iminobutanoate/2-iminopropanoate deaminase